MFNKLILALGLVLVSATYIQAQEFFDVGYGCGNGGCSVSSGGYYYSSPPVYYSRPAVVYGDSLHLHLRNVAGGERTRYYVDIYVDEDKYAAKIPVINGILPDVTVYKSNNGRVTDLVLDYGVNRKYNNSYGSADGYIHYGNPEVKKSAPTAVKAEGTPTNVRRNDTPSAVKSDELPSRVTAPETILPMPKKSLSRPSDSEIDDLFKQKTKIETPAPPTGGLRNPSDAEIESLLRKPSTVNDGGSAFPNYDR